MRRTHFFAALFAVLLLLGGCAGLNPFSSDVGPGTGCDTCAVAESKPVGTGSQAAAAAATGGQQAHQAPFANDVARLAPKTAIGRGAGDVTTSSADMEHRPVASGGAQNLALLNPATAVASTGGGVSAAVQEAQKTVASWRAALSLAMTDQHVDMAKLEFISAKLSAASADLNAAEAAAAASRPNVTHNYGMGGDNTIVGYSRSGNGEGPDSPAAMAAQAAALGKVLKKPADSSGEASDVPPAGPAPILPPNEGGG